MNLATTSFALACPACGAAGGLWLFFLVLGVFLTMFTGTVLLFASSWGRKEWTDDTLRWSAVVAEERALGGHLDEAKVRS